MTFKERAVKLCLARAAKLKNKERDYTWDSEEAIELRSAAHEARFLAHAIKTLEDEDV